MHLRHRLIAILLAAMALLVAAFAAMGWLSDQRWSQRYDEVLLQNQRIAWDKLQNENLDRQDVLAQQLLADAAIRDLPTQGATARVDALLAAATRRAPGVRIDVFDRQGALVATTEPGIDPQPIAEGRWVASASGQGGAVRGLSQVAVRQYQWVVVRGFDGGALAVGQDVAPKLSELATYLGGDIFLANMRGAESVGTRAGVLAATETPIPVRSNQAVTVQLQDHDSKPRALRIVSQPVRNPDARIVGALVWMQDVSATHYADLMFSRSTLAAALVFAALLAAGLVVYLRHAMEPLSRSVGVLNALARGATDASLDQGEEDAEDESGEIARGVVAIRSELLNLETLRQERIRTRQQQERLIRGQLRTLADSLDPASREEILVALGSNSEAQAGPALAEGGGGAAPTNHLAELAGILGRMSGLVTNQQNRLLKLLRELQAAVQTQATLASLQQELEIARQMQLSILPRSAPDVDEVDIAATMIAAKEIGGDFYDYFPIDDEHLAVVVADVSGKGVPAAFFMAISRTLLKSNALFLREPGATIRALNDQLCAENDQMMFVTVFYSVLHLPTGRLVYVNAGHNPPVRLTGDGAALFPRGRNMALAVMEEQEYIEGEVMLAPGETVVLYTDGVTEATNADNALFGDDALLAAMAAIGSDPRGVVTARIPDQLVRAVRGFENGAAQADDITVVALTYRGRRL